MSVSLEMPVEPHTADAPAPSAEGELLLRVLTVIERERIPYCLLHGYENFPQTITGDVDILVAKQFVPNELAKLLDTYGDELGASVVQWFDDGAHFIVLAARGDDDKPVYLQLHVSTRYEMKGRIFFNGNELLHSRQRHGSFYVPAPALEFACVLGNRLTKGVLNEDHIARLTRLHAADPNGCDYQAHRLLPRSAGVVIEAIAKDNWHFVEQSLDALQQELLTNPAAPSVGICPKAIAKKIARWVWPRNGFHAVFLGPDGVGKSTTIETFQRDLTPVFLRTMYLTFAPGLLPQKFAPPKPDGPHSLPPRSLPASLMKAAWWLVCYTFGYFATIQPTLARGGLVVNHRYLVDAIVDQKRYRYSGPVWLLRMIWAVAPKPDVIFLLDAPAEVIQKRKQEVPYTETVAQVEAYRNVIGKLSIGRIIDASQPRPQVAAEVEWYVLDQLAARVAKRFARGGSR